MRLSFWRFQLFLFLLYLVWGNFFTAETLINQAVFNFAVFYPVGFLEGYWPAPGGKKEIYQAAVIFNCLTYLIAFVSGVYVQNLFVVFADFLSMIIFVQLGIVMGRRLKEK